MRPVPPELPEFDLDTCQLSDKEIEAVLKQRAEYEAKRQEAIRHNNGIRWANDDPCRD